MPPIDENLKSHENNILIELSKIYNLQKENAYFIINNPNKYGDYKSNLKIFTKSSAYDDLLDLNLLQMSNLENLMKKVRQESVQKELEKYVFDVIKNNQFPNKCENIQVNLCESSKGCGFGCQMHHILYCFIVSLAQGLPLVVDSRNWHGFNSLDDLFEPLTDKCLESAIDNKNIVFHKIPIIEDGYKYTQYLPTTVPVEIIDKIQKFHSNPFLWWSGQLIKYIFRFKEDTRKRIHKFDFPKPIVGFEF